MEDMGCIGGIVLAETIRSLDRAALGFDNWTVSPIILQTSWLIELGPNEVLWYIPSMTSSVLSRQMGIDQTVSIVDGTSVDSVITLGVTRAILKAWVRDHHMRPRRTALLSALEGWAQVGTDDADGTDEEIVMAPRTGEVGEDLAPKDNIEDVAPRRRQDT
ncbi:hypothetical protein JCGZ_01172 [Jatropha curcas]|uniref:Uncharacterized protein n=1 Tax=Jatropha curcas TaxID=180498 RepID=A0A067JU69_JATCU|nr:hypothetical protein JCGZ_01172 [Jatropha curcas]